MVHLLYIYTGEANLKLTCSLGKSQVCNQLGIYMPIPHHNHSSINMSEEVMSSFLFFLLHSESVTASFCYMVHVNNNQSYNYYYNDIAIHTA